MTQPYALFLADILEDAGKPADIAEKCAAELRRLHAELERCKQVCAATSEAWREEAALAEEALHIDTLRMAREAGFAVEDGGVYTPDAYGPGDVTQLVKRFAALVAAAEREACAKVCDEFESEADLDAGFVLAAAIRARGRQ